jgi:hypothetical protein
VLRRSTTRRCRARGGVRRATLRLRGAEARKVHNGARARSGATREAAVREAGAVVDNTTAGAAPPRSFRDAVISRAELDNAEQAFKDRAGQA